MSHRQMHFVVSVFSDMPWKDTAEYVEDAVKSWGGQYFSGDMDNPEPDPRWELTEHPVTVKQYKRQKGKK